MKLDAVELLSTVDEMVSGAPHTAFVFTARALDEPRPDNREIIEAGYFPVGNLPRSLGPIAARRLEAWRAGAGR